MNTHSSRRLAVTTLFGVIAFLSKAMLPTPIDKAFIVVQVLTFALASLLIDKWGATYASTINGALLSIIRARYVPFTLMFSITYGLLIDIFIHTFNVKTNSQVKTIRLTAALTLSTIIVGLISMCTAVIIGLMPMIPTLYLIIFITGTINGIAAGYLTSLTWNKYLTHYLKEN